jgi:hypothetical protein
VTSARPGPLISALAHLYGRALLGGVLADVLAEARPSDVDVNPVDPPKRRARAAQKHYDFSHFLLQQEAHALFFLHPLTFHHFPNNGFVGCETR